MVLGRRPAQLSEPVGAVFEHAHDRLAVGDRQRCDSPRMSENGSPGLRDKGEGGEHVPLMCAAWNSPGYQELERLLPRLSADAPRLHRAAVATFVHPRFVRRAYCPRCRGVAAPVLVGELHTHGRKHVVPVARMVRVPLFPVESAFVDEAVDWLADHWRGEPFVPDELLPLVTVA